MHGTRVGSSARSQGGGGDLYEFCPDDLLAELNGAADSARLTALLKRYRALRR
ncbi:hypothetical protein ACIP2X_21330 [Streptomyces sp. NPDC089424]|uniref:hypothetical protein n=1 Tax=Streptomyces sp. NPDC089424 TaxID=3365917 RepID=UPI00382EBE7A